MSFWRRPESSVKSAWIPDQVVNDGFATDLFVYIFFIHRGCLKRRVCHPEPSRYAQDKFHEGYWLGGVI